MDTWNLDMCSPISDPGALTTCNYQAPEMWSIWIQRSCKWEIPSELYVNVKYHFDSMLKWHFGYVNLNNIYYEHWWYL
jgi:hypothetical protein